MPRRHISRCPHPLSGSSRATTYPRPPARSTRGVGPEPQRVADHCHVPLVVAGIGPDLRRGIGDNEPGDEGANESLHLASRRCGDAGRDRGRRVLSNAVADDARLLPALRDPHEMARAIQLVIRVFPRISTGSPPQTRRPPTSAHRRIGRRRRSRQLPHRQLRDLHCEAKKSLLKSPSRH